MEDSLTKLKLWVSGILGVLTGFWGWFGWLLVLWIICMIADYVTGTLAAIKAGEWSSKVAREGIWHKLGMIFTVALTALADLLLEIVLEHLPIINIPFAGVLCPVLLVWYIVTEIGSSTENAVEMGAPVPAFLKAALQKANEMAEQAGETIVGDGDNKGGNQS